MKSKTHRGVIAVCALALSGLLAAGPALADKPDWAGKEKHKSEKSRDKSDKRDKREYREERRDDRRDDRRSDRRDDRDDRRADRYFSDRHRTVVHTYYVREYRSGRCPPGLAKKRNGCVPPGVAKKWRKGRVLPREVVYYDPPAAIIVELGAPPPRHRYVRVGVDILLIAVGTGMVIDAIEDLGRM